MHFDVAAPLRTARDMGPYTRSPKGANAMRRQFAASAGNTMPGFGGGVRTQSPAPAFSHRAKKVG
jgi:hypothetical protein